MLLLLGVDHMTGNGPHSATGDLILTLQIIIPHHLGEGIIPHRLGRGGITRGMSLN